MSVTINEDVVRATGLSDDELVREVAVMLFAQDRLTLEQAFRLARMDRISFQHLLSSRGIEMHYTVDDLEQDIDTLKQLGQW